MPTPSITNPMSTPTRTLGLFSTACVVIGAIIGVGIFFNPGKVAALVPSGSWALLAWTLAGMLALCGALAFAELGRRRHGQGAQYQILRDAFGPFAGFLFVFCNATAVQAGAIAVIAIICAENIAAVVLPPGQTLGASASLGLSIALIVAVTLANAAGVRWGSALQNATVIAKIAALLAIGALALLVSRPVTQEAAPPTTALSPLRGVLAALVPAFFAYGGWQHALWISGEVKDPRRTLPLAILIGTAIVVFVYLSANAAYLSLLGHAGVASSRTLAADAVASAWPGGVGRRAVAGAVAISAFGVLNAQLLSGPRLLAGMAADGRFFRAFAARTPTRGTPLAAILLLTGCALVLLLAFGKDADRLITGVVVVDGVFFALTALAIFILPSEGRPLPLARPAAALFILGELALLTGSTLDPGTYKAAYYGAAWIAAAAVLYFVAFHQRNNSSETNSEPHPR